MKIKIKFIIVAFFLILSIVTSSAKSNTDVLAEYYSKLLSYNLTHIMDLTRSLYHLYKEPSFKKEYLEHELNRLDDEIKYTNTDIAIMIEHISKEDLERIQEYLDNIDKHLAQVYVDIKTLRDELNSNEQVNIPKVVSDIYYQIKNAENKDHLEIKKLQNYMNDNLSEIPKNER